MPPLHIGFTGTRKGMTRQQMRVIYDCLWTEMSVHHLDVTAHHGDCTGADAEFSAIATVLGCRTVAHPPLNPRYRAFCKTDETREPQDYLARDWAIVFETAELLAAPENPEPDPHSGTWITTGYAQQLRRKITLITPEGACRREDRIPQVFPGRQPG